jgi:hypothetical protein
VKTKQGPKVEVFTDGKTLAAVHAKIIHDGRTYEAIADVDGMQWISGNRLKIIRWEGSVSLCDTHATEGGFNTKEYDFAKGKRTLALIEARLEIKVNGIRDRVRTTDDPKLVLEALDDIEKTVKEAKKAIRREPGE